MTLTIVRDTKNDISPSDMVCGKLYVVVKAQVGYEGIVGDICQAVTFNGEKTLIRLGYEGTWGVSTMSSFMVAPIDDGTLLKVN